MRMISWIGYIRFLLPAYFIYMLSVYSNERLLNHQPIDSLTLFIRVIIAAAAIYVMVTIISRFAKIKIERMPILPVIIFNILGFAIFTLLIYFGAVLANNRCTSEPVKSYLVLATDYNYARNFTPASVKVEDWTKSGADRWLTLQLDQLQRLTTPTLVTVFIQPGALGYDWLLDVKLGAQPNTAKNPSAGLPPLPEAYCQIASAALQR